MYEKVRAKYYNNLDVKKVTDNRKFWRTVKPFLTDKGSSSARITLVKGDAVILDANLVSCHFSNFFQNAVKSIGISSESYIGEDTTGFNDPIAAAVQKFSKHPSVVAIREKLDQFSDNTRIFDFQKIDIETMDKEVSNLNSKKKGTFCNIAPNDLKETGDICNPILLEAWNSEIIEDGIFPTNLKLADISPVYKKEDRTLEKNYRPVSVLPTSSKIFERLMQQQINSFMDKYLSPLLCGYRKGFNPQTALTAFVEKWKKMLDKKGFASAMLMDLSKAFDTIDHSLVIAKLHAYGFSLKSLKLIHNYLSDRWQRVKIDSYFSDWTELSQGVPQGSVLGPLLFNIYLNDLFFVLDGIDICNFADDTTPYICGKNLSEVLEELEKHSEKALQWFEYNFMKMNPDKCHLLISGYKHEVCFASLDSNIIWEDNTVKLLGITIDRDLKFDTHITNICDKASKKLCALMRLSKILSVEKRRALFKAFIESQFKYCPLVWMMHSRDANNKINKIHERALRFVYKDYESTFDELLNKDGSFSVHHCNIQLLATEVFKSLKGLANKLTSEIFSLNSQNGTDDKLIAKPQINTVSKGENSLAYFGHYVWNMVPTNIKCVKTVTEFKNKIRSWKPSKCLCKLCKPYISGVGYVDIYE